MHLSSIILSIVSQMNGERTINAGLHLLRGKRSGQTLQDVEYFNLKAFFGILPKLQTALYDEATQMLINEGYLSITSDSLVNVTEKGQFHKASLPQYQFNGWDYRGNENIFFSRLSLLVQTVSNLGAGEKFFMPTEKEEEVQQYIKMVLQEPEIWGTSLSNQILQELYNCFEVSPLSDIQKIIITHRLVGYELTGWTWSQLGQSLKLNIESVRLLFIEGLHIILQTIETETHAPLLRKMAKDIKVSTYLTASAVQTKQFFDKGMSMESIAQIRNLKMSTIEDHFVELSMSDLDFPITQFISSEAIRAVLRKSEELNTKRLRLLKDEFEELTYFQLRLILSFGMKGEIEWRSDKF